jgi:hypothetical protein
MQGEHGDDAGGLLATKFGLRNDTALALVLAVLALSVAPLAGAGGSRQPLRASAPPMISISSFVIAAWRARL